MAFRGVLRHESHRLPGMGQVPAPPAVAAVHERHFEMAYEPRQPPPRCTADQPAHVCNNDVHVNILHGDISPRTKTALHSMPKIWGRLECPQPVRAHEKTSTNYGKIDHMQFKRETSGAASVRRSETLTEADCLQAQFEIGDEVTFPAKDDTRMIGIIEKLNRKTATVRCRTERWRVPYALLEPNGGQRREGRYERLLDVAQEAGELMDKHGLKSWNFRFSSARRAIGLCKEKEKIIQLGRHHAANDPPEQVTDTILHEIAHALAGAAAGHGPSWCNVAKRIGATPRATEAGDPMHDQEVKNGFNPGAKVSFRSGSRSYLTGVVVKLNRKTARVSCGDRMLLVPYGCIAEAQPDAESAHRPGRE